MPAPDHATSSLWKDACETIAHVLSFDQSPAGRVEFARSVLRLQSAVLKRMVEADVGWQANTLTKDSRRNGSGPDEAGDDGERAGWQIVTPLRLKAVRMAYAVARDEPSMVSKAEARAIVAANVGGRVGSVMARAARRRFKPVGPGDPIRYDLRWGRSAVSGKMHEAAIIESATGLTMRRVADAPVVAVLARPDGGELRLREVDGAVYRPVAAPGSWEPVTASEFVDAATTCPAWVDNPFSGGLDLKQVRMSLEDCASRAKVPGDDKGRREKALARTGSVAASLIDVGGIVHRRVDALSLGVTAVGETEGHRISRWVMRPYWRTSDGVWSLTNMDVNGFSPEHVRRDVPGIPERPIADAAAWARDVATLASSFAGVPGHAVRSLPVVDAGPLQGFPMCPPRRFWYSEFRTVVHERDDRLGFAPDDQAEMGRLDKYLFLGGPDAPERLDQLPAWFDGDALDPETFRKVRQAQAEVVEEDDLGAVPRM